MTALQCGCTPRGDASDIGDGSGSRGIRLDILTVVLMLCAAALHASWHALVKSSDNGLTVLTGMSLVATVVAAIGLPFVAVPPAVVWPVLGVSLLFHFAYRFCLAQAYAHGDLGAAYPLARGLVPIFAMVVGIWALGQTPMVGQLVGVSVVSAGVCWLASEAVRKLQGRLLLAAAGVGIAVAGYSILDSYGVRLSESWLSFTLWLIVVDSGSFVVLMFILRGRPLWDELGAMRGRTVTSGLLGVLSFSVFLWALSRGPVGPVAALRETSVLFAVLIGMALYREKRAIHRFAAALLIIGGVVLIAAAR
jgi:drug/metabolite transporter (DMT)-like permease